MVQSKDGGSRNGKIELFRFICAVIIFLFHFSQLVNGDRFFFLSGALAVEFFFILSGYLMMASIDRAGLTSELDLGSETLGFLKRKVSVLYPEVLIAYMIGFAVRLLAKEGSFIGAVKLAVDSFWEVLMLRQTGLSLRDVNHATWYLSSMLICMVILYPLLRKFPNMMGRIVVPLVSVLIMGILCRNYSTPRDPAKWIGWTYKGNLRAFSELGMGVLCFQITKPFRQIKLTKLGKVVCTCLEPVLYALFIAYMVFCPSSNHDWILVPILVLAIGLTFSEQTHFPHILDHKVIYFLGKCSLPLYLCHYFWASYLLDILPKNSTWKLQFLSYLGLCLATATVIFLLSELWRRCHVGTKLLRLFVQESADTNSGKEDQEPEGHI